MFVNIFVNNILQSNPWVKEDIYKVDHFGLNDHETNRICGKQYNGVLKHQRDQREMRTFNAYIAKDDLKQRPASILRSQKRKINPKQKETVKKK